MMFVCAKCGTVDNTALAGHAKQIADGRVPLCTLCQGRPWHRQFPVRQYDPYTDGLMREDRTITDEPDQEAA